MSLILPIRDGIDDSLSLRLVQPQHAEAIARAVLSSRASVGQWMPWCTPEYNVEQTREWIELSLQRFGQHKELPLSILERGEVVGGSGFAPWESVDRPSWGVTAARGDIGYWLTDAARGRGIATRAAAALCDYGFAEWGMHRITIRAEPGNEGSNGVPRRLEFRCEGTMRKVCRWRDRWIDHHLYAMTDDDWPAARNAWLARFTGRRPEAGRAHNDPGRRADRTGARTKTPQALPS